ncbi:hypothetical protein MMC25_007799 [Agyrium rufum]|nr:hypothetical protein [Agyrium rufum]
MSLALLKRLLLPSRPPSPPGSKSLHSSCDVGEPKTSSLNDTDSEVTLDVEAQCNGLSLGETSKRRFTPSPRMISDAIIGLSDGLTVPFALTAGLSSLGDTRLVVLGGLAELIAGAISMGLGGFIGAKSEAESYRATVTGAKEVIQTSPSQVSSIVQSVFKPFGLGVQTAEDVFQSMQDSPERMLDFIMRFHYQQVEPDTSRPFVSAATIAAGYFFGGFLPLLPYFCVKRNEVLLALWWSIGIMVVALFAFGWTKTGIVCGWSGNHNFWKCAKGALQMVVIGSMAAGAAVGLVRAINHN